MNHPRGLESNTFPVWIKWAWIIGHPVMSYGSPYWLKYHEMTLAGISYIRHADWCNNTPALYSVCWQRVRCGCGSSALALILTQGTNSVDSTNISWLPPNRISGPQNPPTHSQCQVNVASSLMTSLFPHPLAGMSRCYLNTSLLLPVYDAVTLT